MIDKKSEIPWLNKDWTMEDLIKAFPDIIFL